MRLKWGETELKYFTKPIKNAERTNEWSWWAVFGAMIVMEVIFIGKILGRW